MQACHKSELYDPLQLLTFIVDFDNDNNNMSVATKTIEYLKELDLQDLQSEANKFFIWIVKYNVGLHLDYAEALLNYFHTQNLLIHKKCVTTAKKQEKPRYVVIYDMQGKFFSKIYSSVHEMKEDTGKKPSKLCKIPIDNLPIEKIKSNQ